MAAAAPVGRGRIGVVGVEISPHRGRHVPGQVVGIAARRGETSARSASSESQEASWAGVHVAFDRSSIVCSASERMTHL
jgi:hypothetical protein